MRKLVLLLGLLSFLTLDVFSQRELVVYFTPSSLLKGEIELDLELGLSQYPNSKFLVGSRLRGGQLNNGGRYTKKHSKYREGTSGDDIFKMGLDLQHKLILRNQDQFRNRVYLSYGVGYSYSKISYDIIPISSGVGISTDKEIYSNNINTVNFTVLFGKEFRNKKYLVLDFFSGIKFNKSFNKLNAPVVLRDYNEGYLSAAYTGVAPVLGFRIGLLLQKFAEK